MAVKLRLRRMGRKKRPFYRIVAADSRSPRDGRFIEEIGYYNPLKDPIALEVSEDRALYWLNQGAIPTHTVKSLLRKKGIIMRFDLMKRGVPEDKIEEEMKKWELLQLERQKRLTAKKEAEAAAKKPKAEPETEAPAEETPVAEAPSEAAVPEPEVEAEAPEEKNAAVEATPDEAATDQEEDEKKTEPSSETADNPVEEGSTEAQTEEAESPEEPDSEKTK